MDYAGFFEEITGHPLLPFQERVAGLILSGRSVVLRAPTGSGKTWATAAPFLYSLAEAHRFADRLLYALPLRSLAGSMHREIAETMRLHPEYFGEVRTAVNGRRRGHEGPFCSLQIGGEKNDPLFESDLVFTTIDQLLSSYLLQPVALPRKLRNINAGALIGSCIVFDELHLLDGRRALGTAIEMLERLGNLCQFVLMTATLCDDSVDWLADKLGAVPLLMPEDEIRALPAERGRHRTWRWSAAPLSADAVLDAHQGGRSIALLNSVQRAQNLYDEIDTALGGAPTKRLLLHARFYPEDRRNIEAQLGEYFGPEASKTDVVLVSTQVIEAGIDISAEQLHSELAPMNALVQRAGRAARYKNRNRGAVTVYERDSWRLYDKREVEATRALLSALPQDGRLLGANDELAWVQRVHAAGEAEVLGLHKNLATRRSRVHEAMDGMRERLPELVRNAASVNMIVAARPSDLALSGRWPDGRRRGWPRTLQIAPGALSAALTESFNDAGERWVAQGAADVGDDGVVQWESIASASQIGRYWLVAVHPDFAAYDSRRGLILGRCGPDLSIEYAEAVAAPPYSYEFELWTTHSRRAVAQARSLHPLYANGARLLARSFDISQEKIELFLEFACAVHDAGKLTYDWQRSAWACQKAKDEQLRTAGWEVPVRPDVALAHTTYDPRTDTRQHLPPHAVEGSYAVASLIEPLAAALPDGVGALALRAALSAIARHHTGDAALLSPFRLDTNANESMQEALSRPVPALEQCPVASLASDFCETALLKFDIGDHEPAWGLYVFFARRLRLADQLASAECGERS